jgi:hypothetical protein
MNQKRNGNLRVGAKATTTKDRYSSKSSKKYSNGKTVLSSYSLLRFIVHKITKMYSSVNVQIWQALNHDGAVRRRLSNHGSRISHVR